MASEPTIRTIVVDDEVTARSRLRQLLKDEPDFQIVAECANGQQAVAAIQREKPDLVFLDMQMPRLSGLELCEQLATDGSAMPLVIFVTAYDQYALKAFEVHAIDYLLKPFDRARFQRALAQAREQLARLRGTGIDPRLTALLNDLRQPSKHTDRLVYKQSGRVLFIKVETLDWIEADGNYVRMHAGGEQHYVRETLAAVEAQLPPDQFMRISRSTIVNLDRVKELQPLFYSDYAVLLRDGSRLEMSRHYRDRLETLLARRK